MGWTGPISPSVPVIAVFDVSTMPEDDDVVAADVELVALSELEPHAATPSERAINPSEACFVMTTST
jgi:hypothetical protein